MLPFSKRNSYKRVNIYKRDYIYLSVFDVSCTFEFGGPTNFVCPHGIGEYLFGFLSGVLVVKHGTSDLELSLFNEVHRIRSFTLSVEVLAFDGFDILELVADLSN